MFGGKKTANFVVARLTNQLLALRFDQRVEKSVEADDCSSKRAVHSNGGPRKNVRARSLWLAKNILNCSDRCEVGDA